MTTGPNSIFQLKVTLQDIRPLIWRTILVPGGFSLPALHDAIQIAMGWQYCHLYAFERRGVLCIDTSEWDDFSPRDRDCQNISVAQMFAKEGQSLVYRYDMGDDWVHKVVLEARLPRKRATFYPQCTGGARRCPQEDCGGPGGYADMVAALKDPEHEDHKDMRTWAGDNYDPEKFDLEVTNARLKQYYGRGHLDVAEFWQAAQHL